MIRINLITEKKKKKRARGPRNFLVTVAIIAAAALLSMSIITFLLKSGVAQLRAQSESNKAVIATLSKKISEIKKYEQLNKELAQRGNVIEMLRKNQAVPVRLLDELSGIIPEGVWLNSLAYHDNGVNVEGYAFTNLDLVFYVDNLKKSPNFADVYLEESREADVEKVRVYKFKLNFKVKA